jgi:hypothetical protein
VSATFISRISFVIIVGKKDIKKLSVLPSSHNINNFNYHNKICHDLLLPLNQKPRHLSFQLKLSPPTIILIRMLKRRSTMLTRRRCFKPMPLKFKLYKNELESLRAQLPNLKGKSSHPTNHAQPVHGSGSQERPPRSFYGLSHDAVVGEYVLSNAQNSSLTPKFATSFCPSYFMTQKASVAP